MQARRAVLPLGCLSGSHVKRTRRRHDRAGRHRHGTDRPQLSFGISAATMGPDRYPKRPRWPHGANASPTGHNPPWRVRAAPRLTSTAGAYGPGPSEGLDATGQSDQSWPSLPSQCHHKRHPFEDEVGNHDQPSEGTSADHEVIKDPDASGDDAGDMTADSVFRGRVGWSISLRDPQTPRLLPRLRSRGRSEPDHVPGWLSPS
jgi:hypothetical protein